MRFLLLALLLPLVATASDTRDLGPASYAEMQSEKRVALVIGNGAYSSGALRNPPSDARAVAARLEGLGFEVTVATDLDQNAMKTAIIDFGQQLEAGGVGLFFYAGHGIQHSGRNYLVPIGARISDEAYIDVMAVDVNLVLAGMDAARNRLNIVVLDACRNNPFASKFRSQQQGLAQLNAPTGTFIAFATGPGDVAEDGAGDNSSFTQALVSRLDSQGVELEKVFKAVRQDVYQATGGSQTPWTNSSVMGDFYFALPDTGDTGTEEEPEPVPSVVHDDPPAPPPVEPDPPAALDPQPATSHIPAWDTDIDWVRIPGGSFTMGSEHGDDDELPLHAVQVSAFELSRTEVTFAQYQRCVDDGACEPPHVDDGQCTVEDEGFWREGVLPASFQQPELPVVCVSWWQASAYARWAGARLPSEAEWEYAARAGHDRPWGEVADETVLCQHGNIADDQSLQVHIAWNTTDCDDGVHGTAAVGSYQANELGLVDMLGNVWEWVEDGYGRSYEGAPVDGAAWLLEGAEKRVSRGGSWVNNAHKARCAQRMGVVPGSLTAARGFRVARDLAASSAPTPAAATVSEPPMGQAQLCLARSSQSRGFLVPITVWGGNLELAALAVGEHSCVAVEPGEIWLQAAYAKRANRRNLTLDIEEGETRYLELRAGDGVPNFADMSEEAFEAGM
jgi:formylglycine-generating enzyme required for sulfatase activity